jgi:uncharacterized protein involved in exopolysaccharide biosynthesis
VAPVQPNKPASLKEIDFGHIIHHYISLMWRWKWWLMCVFPVMLVVSLFGISKILSKDPALEATILIGTENTANMGAFGDFFGDGTQQGRGDANSAGKAALIKSRNFLLEIVQKLSLRLWIDGFNRNEIFDSVDVETDAKNGAYKFVVDKTNRNFYSISYSSGFLSFSSLILERGKIQLLDTLILPGIYLKFSQSFLQEPHDFTFGINSIRGAVEGLYKNIVIIPPNPYKNISHTTVSLTGKDYALIAKTINTIGDAFIEKNIIFRRRKTITIIENLEKQFNRSKNDLAQSEGKLRNFRTSTPKLNLTAGAQQTVTNLSSLESITYDFKTSLTDARKLNTKLSQTTDENKIQVASEILIFLRGMNSTEAPVLESAFTQLLQERKELTKAYAVNHPVLQENKKSIDQKIEGIHGALLDFIKTIETAVTEKSSKIKELSQELQRLPTQELQLAELQRDQQITSEVYATIMNRYNQAKVSDAVDVVDMYIMDYAVPPVPPPTDYMKIFGICIALTLLVTFGPMIVFDMINKTVRTESELTKMTGFMVLESIPKIEIRIKKKKKKESDGKK